MNEQENGDVDTQPDQFETDIDGNRVAVRKVDEDEKRNVLNHRGMEETNQHDLEVESAKPSRNQFGLQDGFQPLEKHDSRSSSELSQGEKDEKEQYEIREREEKERREFYDSYRNPLARLRAKYPQAPAEFLAVSTQHRSKYRRAAWRCTKSLRRVSDPSPL